MNNENNNKLDNRTKAEQLYSENKNIPADFYENTEKDEFIQELEVYQIELELQNEELRKSQIELEESRVKYFEFYDTAPCGYLTLDHLGIIKEANLTASAILGVDKNKLLNRGFSNFFVQDYVDELYNFRNKCLNSLKRQSCELKLIKKSCTSWIRLDGIVTGNSNETDIFIKIAITDITESKQAEDVIKERNKELQAFFRLSKIVEKKGLTFDSLYQEITNILPLSWQYPEITCARITINSKEFITENYTYSKFKLISNILINGTVAGNIEVGYHEERTFLNEERLLIDALAERLGHIAERKHAEEELKKYQTNLEKLVEERTEKLKKSEELFKAIYEHAPVFINSFDESGHCLLWNKESEKTFGWTMEELNQYKNPLELFYPDKKILNEVINTITNKPKNVFIEWHPLTKDGSVRICMWANFKLFEGNIISIGYDITEHKNYEALSIRTQKLEALGSLAGGIAHDFNNILTGIYGNISLAKMKLSKDHPILNYLEESEQSMSRAKQLTGQLLTFSSGGAPIKENIRLRKFIEEVIRFWPFRQQCKACF